VTKDQDLDQARLDQSLHKIKNLVIGKLEARNILITVKIVAK
jgi:hypothetical protein